MADNVEITVNGIQKLLRRYDYTQALAEYIWNGFDAKATTVELRYETTALGFITKMEIEDNGYGIQRSRLAEKFTPFFDSEKAIEIDSPKNTSVVHGKNGVGRLTFFTFCGEAAWRTVFEENKKKFFYQINIKVESLNKYDSPETSFKEVNKNTRTGTVVSFYTIYPQITQEKLETELWEFLCFEFGWFLELNRDNGHQLLINGTPLDYGHFIGDKQQLTYADPETGTSFDLTYIRWAARTNKEYSRYYYIGQDNKERYKEYTSLNNKGDQFYHSLYVKSSYFDNFIFKSSPDSVQISGIGGSRNDGVFRRLHQFMANYLRDKRRPFLHEYTSRLIDEYETEGVFPQFGNNVWEVYRKQELETVVRNLYEVEPKIFVNLNTEQKKTFVRLLNLILDSDERDKLFDILGEVVELTAEEREQMADILKVTRLSHINQAIRLIEDRYQTIAHLRELIANPDLAANEVNHLQTLIENHYWIFGEQYHLVTAAEQRFEEALRRYTHLLRGEKKTKKIAHEDKNKEMDIFLCRQDILTNEIKNVVVELKHPLLKLGEKELTQVKTYMNVILNEPEFNGNNMSWEFYLVGTDFNKKGEIEAALDNAKPHGEKSLAFKTGQYKIYVRKWSEIMNEFEMKHKFLNEKLRLERTALGAELNTADRVLTSAVNNTASAPKRKSA